MIYLFVCLLPLCPDAFGSADDDSLFRWRLVGSERVWDGGHVSFFRLEGIDAAGELPEIAYRVAVRKSAHQIRRDRQAGKTASFFKAPKYYRKKLDADGILRIYSGHQEQIELWAKIRRGEQSHYAQTALTSYGESGLDDSAAERISAFPDWPFITLIRGSYYGYRVQAGSELTFRIEPPPAALDIFENGVPMAQPPVNDKGIYRYTPPHDDELSKGGYSATRDLLFVATLPDKTSRFSFSMPIHRAYYARLDYQGGLSVLAASVILCLTLVWFWNRKFPWR